MVEVQISTEDKFYSNFNYSYNKDFVEFWQLLDSQRKIAVQNQEVSSKIYSISVFHFWLFLLEEVNIIVLLPSFTCAENENLDSTEFTLAFKGYAC